MLTSFSFFWFFSVIIFLLFTIPLTFSTLWCLFTHSALICYTLSTYTRFLSFFRVFYPSNLFLTHVFGRFKFFVVFKGCTNIFPLQFQIRVSSYSALTTSNFHVISLAFNPVNPLPTFFEVGCTAYLTFLVPHKRFPFPSCSINDTPPL